LLTLKCQCRAWPTYDVTCTGVAPRTGKIIKNGLDVFEKGENMQNGVLRSVNKLSQSSEITCYKVRIETFLKG